MSVIMEEEIKRWTARREPALGQEIHGETTVPEASHPALGMKTPDEGAA